MSATNNKSCRNAPASAAPGTPPAAATNPPCPTAPSLTLEKYNEIRALAEGMLKHLPPGSYYTLTEKPNPANEGDKYQIAFMAREPGCSEDCQHCRDEAAAKGIPPLSADNSTHQASGN